MIVTTIVLIIVAIFAYRQMKGTQSTTGKDCGCGCKEGFCGMGCFGAGSSANDIYTRFDHDRHMPPFSTRGLLLPYPRYESSLPPDWKLWAHLHQTNGCKRGCSPGKCACDMRAEWTYSHMNDPNVMEWLPYDTEMLKFPWMKGTGIPRYQYFYVKNRKGYPMYSSRPVAIPTVP